MIRKIKQEGNRLHKCSRYENSTLLIISRKSMKHCLPNTWKSQSRIDEDRKESGSNHVQRGHTIWARTKEICKPESSKFDPRRRQNRCEMEVGLWNESRQAEDADLDQKGCDPESICEEPEAGTTIAGVEWACQGGVYPQLPPWKFDLHLQASYLRIGERSFSHKLGAC